MSEQAPGRRAGRVMLVLAWGAALLLATRFFGEWEEAKRNPNQTPESRHGDGFIEVRLASDGRGHFVASGEIDGRPVEFMLDTGATDVAVPGELAKRLGLARGAPITVLTANGRGTGFRTRLAELQLGDIRLHDVRALIVPGMDGEQVLLGMSALKQLEFTQRDGTLVLRHYTEN
ncbi:aspartyl protease [Pseudomonas sp. PIC25]|uniref:retropepsin-like aspartic protease family protein n=1 Tax=Pseudomonas sp. PIC25 TaxID=1958773 RepID=UPI000BABC6C2|nr:TIGR02281 family clan AA aspartic protease [Pseudomonas sp. PIC25]PAU60784.1 aspartyl protease [Pseudomonas sp. PIC25]